jgi:YgiT-type zinc finger domain-containing protein
LADAEEAMKTGSDDSGRCPICGGGRVPGKTTFTAELGTGILVVRGVPATVCDQCGERWIDDETASDLERRAEDARRRGVEVEVVSFA